MDNNLPLKSLLGLSRGVGLIYAPLFLPFSTERARAVHFFLYPHGVFCEPRRFFFFPFREKRVDFYTIIFTFISTQFAPTLPGLFNPIPFPQGPDPPAA